MPRFDGTGPLGRSSMTGKGQGYCVIPLQEIAENPEYDFKVNAIARHPRFGRGRRRGGGNQAGACSR